MQKRSEFGVVVPMGLTREEGVGVEDGFESPPGAAAPVADHDKLCEVVGDLAFVPGDQDGLDVRKIRLS